MARIATYRTKLAHQRKPLRMSDATGLSIGAALLVAILTTLVFVVPKLEPAQHEPTPAEIAAKIRQENLKARMAQRQGSILFVDPDSCSDYAFDNWTGNVRYKNEIDCDERIANMQKSQSDKAAERMRTVIEGFRR